MQAAAVLVERRQRLVGLRQHHRDVLEDVLDAVDVERYDLAALRDRHHQRIGLLGHALGRAVAGPRLEGQDRRIRRQLHVDLRDLRRVRAQHDRAVHLRQLVEQRRRVVELELDPPREQEREFVGVPDHDQPARMGMQDIVDSLA